MVQKYKSKEAEERHTIGSRKGARSVKEKYRKIQEEYFKNPKRCKQCNNIIPYLKRIRYSFCNSTCSAIYNNTRRDPASKNRNSENYCKVCGKRCRSSNCGLCRYHWNEFILSERGKLTKGELVNRNYASKNIYQLIRVHAKALMKLWKIPKSCFVCGYNKHVEVCHIKSIGEFSEITTLSEINSRDNLKYLCPNHHWELDNEGLVKSVS